MGLSGQNTLSFCTPGTYSKWAHTTVHSVLGRFWWQFYFLSSDLENTELWLLVLTNPLVVVVGFADLSLVIICVIFNDGSICGLGICLEFGLAFGHHWDRLQFGVLSPVPLHSLIQCVGWALPSLNAWQPLGAQQTRLNGRTIFHV